MPRMSEKETKLWRDRLRHADMVWRDHGLTDDAQVAGAVAWMNAYRNVTFSDDWGGIALEDVIEVPTAFFIVNTMQAQLFARHPVYDLTATSPDQKDSARLMEVLINHLVRSRKLGIKRQLNRTLISALILNGGIIRHGFTPSQEVFDKDGNRIERFQPVVRDFPWIRNIPLWDFRADPMAETFDPRQDVRWCAFRSLMTMDELERTPGLIKRDDLKPTRVKDVRLSRPNEFSRQDTQAPREDAELVEIWTVYDGQERKWFAISPGTEKTIREPDDWPINWETLPYNWLAFNEQLDDPFPIAPIDAVKHQLTERNKVRTLMAELVKRSRRFIGFNESSINEEDLEKILAGDPDLATMFRFSGDTPISETRVAGLDQTLLLYDNVIEQDIRRTFGQSLMDQGQRINVESATEAAGVRQGATLQAGRMSAPWEDFLSDVGATFGSALQTEGVLTEEVKIPILGNQDARLLFRDLEQNPFVSIRPGQIKGTFIYEVRAGSTLPRNPNEEVARAMQNLQVAGQFPQNVNIPQLLMDYFIAADMDPKRALQSAQEIMQQQQVGAEQGVPQNTPVEASGGNGAGANVLPALLRGGGGGGRA